MINTCMSTINQNQLVTIRQGLIALSDSVTKLADQKPAITDIADRSISGNKIQGGEIAEFKSTGIQDKASKLTVLITDKGLTTETADVDTLLGEVTVTGRLNLNQGASVHGNMFVDGEITASKIHVAELVADVRQERSSPLIFEDSAGLPGKGLLWQGQDNTKQFVFQSNPDRFYSTETLDLHKDSTYAIGKTTVLSQDTLGPGVVFSSLRTVGILNDLKTTGNLSIDQFINWNSNEMRLGIGTDSANALVSIVGDDSEFVIDPDVNKVRLGTFTTSGLDIIVDNTPVLTITETGKITIGKDVTSKTSFKGQVGINTTPDCDLTVAGQIKFSGKKFDVSDNIPTTGFYNKGDIVWNNNPKPTGYVGWICIREGTPGLWKTFGNISQ